MALHNRGEQMPLTSDNDTAQRTTTVRVSIRVPNGGNENLVTDAEQRLTRAVGVVGATVEELHGIEPTLSATRVTATVTVELASSLPPPELRSRLADVSGVDPFAEE
jgi:hypothetical protein